MMTMLDICRQTAQEHLIPFEQMMGKSRYRPFTRARHAAMVSCSEAGFTHTQIARLFGCCHTSVTYAVNRDYRERHKRHGKFFYYKTVIVVRENVTVR